MTVQLDLKPLKEIYENHFLIGTAVCSKSLQGPRFEFVKHHFNAFTVENHMKPIHTQEKEGIFTFEAGDRILEAAEKNGIAMIGHTLVWHEQTPDWINSENLTREEAIANLKKHITTVMKHYKGRILAWDVANEIFKDDVKNPSDWRNALRENPWLKVIGPDFIEIAFHTASEVDPEAILYYNDYNMDFADKREAVYHMVKELKERGVPIHGIGMQGHYNMTTNYKNVENSIKRFAELGIEISITELDITVGAAEGEESLTEKQEMEQALQYARCFKVFIENRDAIKRVTLWGLDDGTNWRGEFFPLPFDKDLQAKISYHAIASPVKFLDENNGNEFEVYAITGTSTYGTPTIDGEIDEIWNTAEVLKVNQYTSAWTGAKATLRTLWNEEYLFALFEVKDSLLNADSENPWEHDSIEIFIDEKDNKSTSFEEDDSQYRINFNNLVNFNNNNDGTISDKFKSATKVVDGGYIVELQIPLLTIKCENNLVIGFDAQVNDANKSGKINSITRWSDLELKAFNTSGWGRLRLVGKS